MTTIDEAKLQETALGGFGLINGLAASLGAHYGMKAGLFEALREWLYQQAAAGTIDHENGEIFSLSPEGVLVFADSSTAASLVGMFEGRPRWSIPCPTFPRPCRPASAGPTTRTVMMAPR